MSWKILCVGAVIVLLLSNGIWAYQTAHLLVERQYARVNLETEARARYFLARLSVDAKISRQRLYEIIRADGLSGETEDRGEITIVSGNKFIFENDIIVDIK